MAATPATGPAQVADGPERRFTTRLDPRGLPVLQTGTSY